MKKYIEPAVKVRLITPHLMDNTSIPKSANPADPNYPNGGDAKDAFIHFVGEEFSE